MNKFKCLLIMLVLFCMVGCNHEVKKAPIINENSRGVVDDFSNQLFMNDKQTQVPTTLNKLGDDYTFGNEWSYIDFINDNGIQCTLGALNYKGEHYAQIALIDTVTKEKNRDSIIYSIMLDSMAKDKFSLSSIKSGSSREDIVDLLGEPNKEGGDVLQYFNKEKSKKDESIVILLDDDQLVNLTINRYPENYFK